MTTKQKALKNLGWALLGYLGILSITIPYFLFMDNGKTGFWIIVIYACVGSFWFPASVCAIGFCLRKLTGE